MTGVHALNEVNHKDFSAENRVFERSVLVVAHPDDEVLWFSSVLQQVDRTVVCFLECPSRPKWTRGRTESLRQLPLNNVQCLGFAESQVYSDLHFVLPVATRRGIKTFGHRKASRSYEDNYRRLKAELAGNLDGAANVFTHNPWGEYGNEEHIQLSRILSELRDKMGFNVWMPSYYSQKTCFLMNEYVRFIDTGSIFALPTDKELAARVQSIYTVNECWTWFPCWQWSDRDYFFRIRREPISSSERAGSVPGVLIPYPHHDFFPRYSYLVHCFLSLLELTFRKRIYA